MNGCLALSHKLPTLDIGHALIQSTPSGWTITGSDKSFPTVEGLLRSRTLTFPRPGEYGAPGQMTVQYPSQGRVSAAADLANVEPSATPTPTPTPTVTSPAQRNNGPPGRVGGGGSGMASSGQMTRAAAAPPAAPVAPAPAPVAFENNEALEKVLTCLVNPNNVTLELFSMNLTSLPSEVNDLHLLQSLYLSNNCFSELPREVLSLSALKTLWIQANNLTSLPPEIERLVNLEKLKVSNNAIDARTGFPAEMARMTNLHEVWIENNKLDVFPPTLLTVTSIKRIWVDHNQVREIPRAIGRLVNLERLSMNKNLVQEVPREIGQLKALEKLWLNDNEVHTVAAEISQCSKLQMLALANNRIANAPDLSMLQLLTDLRLENNPCFNESLHGSAPPPNGAPFQPSNSPTIGPGTTRRASGPNTAAVPGMAGGAGAGGTMRGYTGAPPALAGGAAGGMPPAMASAASSSDHQRVKKVTSSFKLPWQKREDNPLMSLNEAIEASDDKKVKALMKSRKKSPFDLTALDSDGLTPLNKAVKLGDERVVDAIVSSSSLAPDEVNIRDKFGYTPLHWAVRGTNDAILNRLLEVKSIRVDVQNNDQNTPLHYFCEKNHSPDCERIGKMLIDKGALVNKTNNNGETPLHKAIFNTQVRLMMVRLLINNHADVNLLTQQRQSPLQYAVRLQREDLVTMLLKAGARLDLRSSDGLTAHEVAVKERCDKIAALLAECEKLQHWLANLDFERFFPVFVREEILFEQLPDLREDVLTKLGITTAGQRMKLMKAVQELRTERALHTMAAKERAAQLDQPPSFASNAANAEGEWLQQLTAGMDLREGEHIAFTDIELLEELGSGAAGKVYKGLYKGKHVAVKVLKELKDGAELEDFKKELEIMTSIRSPYMIFFYGVVLSPKLCIAEGTLVELADGGARRIERLDELRGAVVAAPTRDGEAVRLGRGAVSHAVDNGVKRCVRVTLDDGRTLDCTPDHELLAANGRWLRADQLVAGRTRLAVSPRAPVADDASAAQRDAEAAFRLTAGRYELHMRTPAARRAALAFARLLGAASEKRAAALRVGHALDRDAVLADAALFDGASATETADGLWLVQFHANLGKALCSLPGMQLGNSWFSLPDFLFDDGTPRSIVAEFLGGLFGGDRGAVRLTKRDVRDHVYLTHTASKDDFERIGSLLGKLGLDFDLSDVRLVLRDSFAFAQQVGFRYCVQKSERLGMACVALRRKTASHELPYITTMRESTEPTLSLVVTSVKPIGKRRVFDLTVPGAHAFVANGIAVHNCMVMEIATRKSLFHVLNRDGLAIGWPQALEWGAQAAGGTACLHQHNIVHRDLKSLNLLVTQDWVIKVADFGLARFNNEGNLETLAKMRGTMAYCVPEEHEILTNRGFMDLETYTASAPRVDTEPARGELRQAQRHAMTFEKPQRLVVQPRPDALAGRAVGGE
jgi:ankyrin repeat protein